jgi:hypothetical protein
MANLVHFALAVLSVVSLLVVRTSQAQRRAIGASTKRAEVGSLRIYDHAEPTFQSEQFG